MSTAQTQEEQIIITDKPHNIKKLIIIFSIITISIITMFFCIHLYTIDETENTTVSDSVLSSSSIDADLRCMTPGLEDNEKKDKLFLNSIFEYIVTLFKDKFIEFSLFNIVPLLLFELFFTLGIKNSKFTMSNKRIFGKNLFGKKFDFPLNDIQSASIRRFSKGLSVATSSGNVNVYFLKNSDEIYSKLNELVATQQQSNINTSNNNAFMQNALNETTLLREYKNLLDSGVITQEEFEEKKKQILNN